MKRINRQLTDLIGNTPLVMLQKLTEDAHAKANILAKLEYLNPGGYQVNFRVWDLLLPSSA